MKLEKQFEEVETRVCNLIDGDYFCRISPSCVTECVEISENFAIGFAEWHNRNSNNYPRQFATKQLLEIYKKTL